MSRPSVRPRQLRRTLLAASLLSATAFAADTATDLGAVVVTATRFGSSSPGASAGVSVITATEIARSSATTVPEILAKLGGVHVRNSSGDTNWQLDLRGFGISGDQNTLVLLDGRRLSENELTPARLTSIPINAIERIEIQRGSGAVLYGGGATAGTINIITRSPGSEGRGATVKAAVGDYGTSDLRATAEMYSGQVGFMVHANRYVSSNYRVNNHDREDKLDGRLSWSGAASSAALRFGSSRQKIRFPGARSAAQLAADPAGSANRDDHGMTDTWNLGIGATHNVGGAELALDVDYRNKKASNKFPASFSANDTDSDTFTVSPRVRIPHHQGVFVAGIDSSRWTFSNVDLFGRADATQTSDAIYFQEDWTPADGTLLRAGARSSSYRDAFSRPAFASRRMPLNAFELLLRQHLAAGWHAYGKWGQSFRVATANENYNVFTGTVGLLQPQKSHDAELGVELAGARQRARAGVFASYVTNEIHLLVLGGTPTFGFGANTNLAPTQRTGLELEGSIEPTGSLSLGAIYRHTRSSFRSGTYEGVGLVGKEVPLVPRDLLTLNASLRLAPGQILAASGRYVGRQRYDNDQINTFALMPTYSLLDLKYSHAVGQWTLALSAENLLDKRYYSYGIRNGAGTSFNAYPELGRRVMASAELKL